jgi:hypothetical protein
MMGAILIFRGVNFPDDHLLCMRILMESIPRRLDDVLIREGQPSKDLKITPPRKKPLNFEMLKCRHFLQYKPHIPLNVVCFFVINTLIKILLLGML